MAKTITKNKTTKKPSGASISRNGKKFTFSWKRGDDYGAGQTVTCTFYTGKKKNTKSWSKRKSATSQTLELTDDQFNKITKVSFSVKGKNKNTSVTKNKNKKNETTTKTVWAWSKAASATFTVAASNRPTLSYSRDTDTKNKGTFAWETVRSASIAAVCLAAEMQTALTSSNGSEPSKNQWSKAASVSTSGSKPYTEAPADLAAGRNVRWFRVRSIGTNGRRSEWRTSHHSYAEPAKAYITSADGKKSGSGTSVTASWKTGSTGNNPVDSTSLMYAVETPASGLACPADASFKEGAVYAGSYASGKGAFVIDEYPGEDEALFVAVKTRHDDNEHTSAGIAALYGILAKPSGLSVSINTSQKTVTVTAKNESKVPGAYLQVYMSGKSGKSEYIGSIPNGSESATLSYSQVDVTSGAARFSVKAKCGTMESPVLETGGAVPFPPANLSAVQGNEGGTALVTWDWGNWSAADGAQIAWSTSENALDSTDEPKTFDRSKLYDSRLYVSGLETGVTWRFWARLWAGTDDVTYSPWSEMASLDLSSVPTAPALMLSSNTVVPGGTVTAYWAFATADGGAQRYAEIRKATVSGGDIEVSDDILASVTSAQSVDIKASDLEAGETTYLVVRTTSSTNAQPSDWSSPAPLAVADAPSCAISSTSLVEVIETPDENDDEGAEVKVMTLAELPLTVTVTGAGEGGFTALAIERAADFMLARPDERESHGFEGETAYQAEMLGAGTFSVDAASLLDQLDDGGMYRIVATVCDQHGQSATDTVEFRVAWAEHPVAPDVTVETDTENRAVMLTIGSSGQGGTCDIYRLSVDRPVLIYEGASYGQTYVDPYPAFGEYGGHRVVAKLANGDYTTEDGGFSWTDIGEDEGDSVSCDDLVVTFGNQSVTLPYEIETTGKWENGFERKKRLDGRIVGFWTAGTPRDVDASALIDLDDDSEGAVPKMRRLADFGAASHVRTPDGSSFMANVNVQEARSDDDFTAEFTLAASAVDADGTDGMTLAEWEKWLDGE